MNNNKHLAAMCTVVKEPSWRPHEPSKEAERKAQEHKDVHPESCLCQGAGWLWGSRSETTRRTSVTRARSRMSNKRPVWEYTTGQTSPGEDWYDLIRQRGKDGWEGWHIENANGFRTIYFKRPKT